MRTQLNRNGNSSAEQQHDDQYSNSDGEDEQQARMMMEQWPGSSQEDMEVVESFHSASLAAAEGYLTSAQQSWRSRYRILISSSCHGASTTFGITLLLPDCNVDFGAYKHELQLAAAGQPGLHQLPFPCRRVPHSLQQTIHDDLRRRSALVLICQVHTQPRHWSSVRLSGTVYRQDTQALGYGIVQPSSYPIPSQLCRGVQPARP